MKTLFAISFLISVNVFAAADSGGYTVAYTCQDAPMVVVSKGKDLFTKEEGFPGAIYMQLKRVGPAVSMGTNTFENPVATLTTTSGITFSATLKVHANGKSFSCQPSLAL